VRLSRHPNESVQAWERIVAVLAVAFAVVLAVRGDWVWAILIGGLCAAALLTDVLLIIGRFLERRAR
jgi:O-antigen/teichoic acid export membrane protein